MSELAEWSTMDFESRHPEEGQGAASDLGRLRGSIDNLDAAVVHLLAERFKCTQEVGELKALHGFPAADPRREAQQIERLRHLAKDAGLDPAFAEKFLTFLMTEVVRHHRSIAETRTHSRGGSPH
jgi:chorismate mutase